MRLEDFGVGYKYRTTRDADAAVLYGNSCYVIR